MRHVVISFNYIFFYLKFIKNVHYTISVYNIHSIIMSEIKKKHVFNKLNNTNIM